MSEINTCYQLPVEAFTQYAERQNVYDAQVGKLASLDGSVESVAKFANVPNSEPSVPKIVQLMGLDQQVATAHFQTLAGNTKEPRQLGSIGAMGDLKRARNQSDDPDIQEAIDLLIKELEMRSFVQGQIGSLVAA